MTLQIIQQHQSRYANNSFLLRLVISHEEQTAQRVLIRVSQFSDTVDSISAHPNELLIHPNKLETINIEGSLQPSCSAGRLEFQLIQLDQDNTAVSSLSREVVLEKPSFRLLNTVDIIEASESGKFSFDVNLQYCDTELATQQIDIQTTHGSNIEKLQIDHNAQQNNSRFTQQQFRIQGRLKNRLQTATLILMLKDYRGDSYILQTHINGPGASSKDTHRLQAISLDE